MDLLRLFINGVRSHPSTINCVTKQLHREQRWYFKCSTASQIADAFLRKTTKVRSNTERLAFCCRDSSNKECNLQQRYKWILSPHMQDTSGSMTNVMHYSQQNSNRYGTKSSPDLAKKSDAKSATVSDPLADIFAASSKLGLYSRFKLITKMYWYVVIPVHVVMSAGWLCAFYYLSQIGVDFQALLHYLHLSENIAEKLQGSSIGHWAVVLLCYKVTTPVRYAVTLGATAVSIKYLVQRGYIKPIPTKAQFVQMYEDKKARRAVAKAKKDNGKK